MRAFDLANEIEKIFKNSQITPYDTGNLKLNSIISLSTGAHTAQVIIGGEIAPYAVYLEYADTFNGFAKGGGRATYTNRHKGFVEKVFQSEVLPYLKGLEK